MGIELDGYIVKFSNLEERIDNSLKNNPATQSVNGDKIFTLFRRLKGKEDGNPLIYALKNKNNYSISRKEVAKFIPFLDNSIVGLSSCLSTMDCIMAVPSSSGISKIIANRISYKLDIPMEDCTCEKKNNATILKELEVLLSKNHDPLEKKEIKKIIRAIRPRLNEFFAMKNVDTFNRYLVNPFQWDNYKPKFDSVILVDDLLASGQTLSCLKKLLLNFGVKEVVCVTLLGAVNGRYTLVDKIKI